MVDIPELSTWTMQNGKTFRFMDAAARLLLKKKYGPDNPPPISRNIWYATCVTAAGTAAKVAVTATGDFILATGSMVRVLMKYSNNQTQPTISIDGSTPKRMKNLSTENNITTNLWRAGEVVDLVYDGTEFVLSKTGLANTTYYGLTKLSNSVSSTSQTLAATPKAVKTAYDLANSKVDAAGAAAAAPVQSVCGKTGAVSLAPSDLGAADYITARGTDGDWTYVKYASGECEAWTTKTFAELASENQLNGWYWTRVYLTPPTFFTSLESANANARWGSGIAWGNIRGASANQLEIVVFGNQENVTAYVWAQIWGAYSA